MNGRWPPLGRWKKTLQGRIGELAAFFQRLLQHGGEYNKRKIDFHRSMCGEESCIIPL
jgi:hypothetical protein